VFLVCFDASSLLIFLFAFNVILLCAIVDIVIVKTRELHYFFYFLLYFILAKMLNHFWCWLTMVVLENGHKTVAVVGMKF